MINVLLLFGFLFRILISFQIYSGDVNNHVSWGKDMLVNGPAGIYGREFAKSYGTMTPTYPPIPLVLFTVSKLIYDNTYSASWYLNQRFPPFPSNFIFFLQDQDTQPAMFKIWAIAADVVIAFIIYHFSKSLLAAGMVLFNPAFFYNSAYWGQLESVPLAFILAALYLLLIQNKYLLSAILFTMALLSKQSSIIFAPLYGLLFLKVAPHRSFFPAFLLAAVVMWLSFIPFYQKGNLLLFPLSTYINKIQTGSGSDYITDHAFNFWALLTGPGPIHDTQTYWLGISYQKWGYLFFFGTTLPALVLFFRRPVSPKGIFLTSAIVSLGAFLFLTRMHERYLEAVLPFVLLSATFHRRLWPIFIFLSAFSFLNLYHNWWAPRIPTLVNFISNPAVIQFGIILTLASFIFLTVTYVKS